MCGILNGSSERTDAVLTQGRMRAKLQAVHGKSRSRSGGGQSLPVF